LLNLRDDINPILHRIIAAGRSCETLFKSVLMIDKMKHSFEAQKETVRTIMKQVRQEGR